MPLDPDRDAKLRGWLEQLRDRPLEPRDDRYVTLDSDGLGLRGTGADPKLLLLDEIELSDAPTCQLFTGFRGTGKSTELRRLKSLAQERGFIVLLADAQEFHSLARNLSIEELLFVVAGAFGSAAREFLGVDPLAAGAWDRLHAWLTKDVHFELSGSIGPAGLGAALKGDDAFLVKLREALAGRVDALAAQVHEFVNATVAKLLRRERTARGVVFVFDNLEKLSAPEPDFRERMQSVVDVFARDARHLRLPGCHTIYSVPLYLQTLHPAVSELYDGRLQVLPTVKVFETRDPDRTPFGPGVAGLQRLIRVRIPALEEAFSEPLAQTERLILASGGHLRGLLVLVHDVLVSARRTGLPVGDEVVDAAIAAFAEKRRDAVRADASLLDGVRRTFAIDHVGDEQLARLARHLDSHLVLCYRNGDGWYDVHPTIREHVRRLAEVSLAAPPLPTEAGAQAAGSDGHGGR